MDRGWRPRPVARGVVVLCLPAMLFASGCSATPEPAPTFRIGVLAILSGPRALSSGQATVNGANLAVDGIHASGGIDVDGRPHRIELVVRGYADRPDAATAAARALINQEQVHAIVGPQLSEHAIPVARLAEQAGVPMISPMSTNPETTAAKEFAFRVAFLDDFQAEVLARFTAVDLAARRVAVLYDVARPYSRDLAGFFRDAVEREGVSVVAFEDFVYGEDTDFTPQLERIRDARPDVLFLPNYTDVDSIQMRQAREVGVQATFLGGDSWDLNSLSSRPETDGAYTSHQWSRELPLAEAEAFRSAFKERFGEEPRITAAMTFDAVGLLAAAYARAGGSDGDALRAAVADTRQYRGATGTIRYDGSGDPTRNAVISRVQGLTSVVHTVVEPR